MICNLTDLKCHLYSFGLKNEPDWIKQLEDALKRATAAPTPPDDNGLRVLAYDAADFISDSKTPTEMLFRPATVKVWRFDKFGRLLADVVFDHGREGGGLFANCLKPLPAPPTGKGE